MWRRVLVAIFAASLGGASLSSTHAAGTFTFVAAQPADLRITKSGPGPTYLTFSPMAYIIHVTNLGPGAASNVVMTDVLPAGSLFLSAVPSQGTCSGTTTITCTFGSVAAGFGASVFLAIRTPETVGPFSNTATVAATEPDPDAANNSSTAVITLFQPARVADIPTLPRWALLALCAMLAFAGFLRT